jgi:phosphohistidine phosphatase
MILYIVRHAWAEDPGNPSWSDDAQRPLTREGQERFAKVVKTLAERGFAPQRIATSPLVRCRETAEIVAKHVRGRPEIIERSELAPHSDLEGILHWSRSQAGECEEVAWVGHAPDVSHMAKALLGSGSGEIRFAKGAIAAIRFDGLPAADRGELWWLVTAKILGC